MRHVQQLPKLFIMCFLLPAGATLASATSTTAFDPYTVENHFWLAAFIFEDVSIF